MSKRFQDNHGDSRSAKTAKLDIYRTSSSEEDSEVDNYITSTTATSQVGSTEPGVRNDNGQNIPTSSTCQESNGTLATEIEAYSVKYKVLDKRLGPSWFKALKEEFDKPYFKKLSDFVTSERSNCTIYPPEDQVWTWTRHCSIDSIKVVILAQDPYIFPGQAHGLCFSVPVGKWPPPSLRNIYQELSTDINNFKTPSHGHLVGWARQGVLLLNSVLTVRKEESNSHVDQGWEELTTAVIKYLNERNKGIVFLLWGFYAQKKAEFVDKVKHHILKAPHPSPRSAASGFFGCKHFSKCNEYLISVNKEPIDWTLLPEE